ncbi:caspase family protein [Waterburya agarophytonicola K14]|uniref:Caspase family protein n=1 Tax=Waterburya agarophytonicola KI4 TaxID=2874699 RepID=A0A964BUM4_9CYAN|nr:caspase family protein [Waterburya agarophytonicola]MCC0179484.1 caspase family protein [Waterburya agarophytonicola KI4]
MCPRVKARSQKTPESKIAKLWILLVGVNQYQDRQNLPSLQYSALDCQGLGEALKEATASFPAKEVIIHHDFVSQPPYIANVQQSIAQIVRSATANDTILFYFSGHGILETTTQQVVLCLADTNTKKLLTTGLPLNTLLKQLSGCAASQQLIWLDACHSGGMTLRGTSKISLPDPSSQLVEVLRHKAAESKGFYALLSCDRSQQSWEFPELGHGVFTYYLMRGLRGEAADSQGIIEADALYQYVYHQTLRYIDKTNQQIRLINQQKSSRGERRLQSEFPLQTPKRIVEGFGKVVLGKRSPQRSQIDPRQALVIDGGHKANATTFALSQVLQSSGGFDLRYFPQTNEPWTEVKSAIATCLNSETKAKNDLEITTALLYLRAEIEVADTGESWLVLGDDTRLSRSWLRSILRNSLATQQIIILDCPGENSLMEWIEDLQLEAERGQCLIAANAPLENSAQFAEAILNTLKSADLEVGLPVAAWITQLQIALAGTGIVPQVWLSGTQGVIEVLPPKNAITGDRISLDLGICPYMGLQAFNEHSAEYFYGRKTLVQKLLNQVNHRLSVAVVGASGSGKSSAVQAGLMASLRQGKQIPGSDRWWIDCFRPGSQPIKALAGLLTNSGSKEKQAREKLQIEGLLYQGVEGFVRWLRSRREPMVLLVIDQFEELFTLAGENERQEFIALIVGALKYAGDRFKLVCTIRADFVASCLEISELAYILQKNSILLPPYLTEADYRHAIIKPAQKVGLEVEPGLTEILLQDLDRSPGGLPLLQFVLQKLWENRDNGKLTLKAYQKLGGIKGALEKQAQAVYDSLDPVSQDCARWIFLNLTQLGDGTEDTRRRITKSELVVAKYPQALIDKTLHTLTDAKLLVVNLDDGNSLGQSRSGENPPEDDELFLEAMSQEATVEVVHEILIRHWSSLRWWLEENRSRLRSQRQIEAAAILWQQKDRQDDFLLKGVRLAEAEEIYIEYTDELSDTATEYVACCIDARLAEQREAKRRLRKAQLTAVALGVLGLAATAFGIGAYRQKLIAQLENIDSLNAVAEAQLLSNQQLESVTTSVKAGKQLEQINGLGKKLVGQDNWQETKYQTTATLQQSIYGTQEVNRLVGHAEQVNTIGISDNGEFIITASDDQVVKIWDTQGNEIETFSGKEAQADPIISHQNKFSLTKLKTNNLSTSDRDILIAIEDETTVTTRSKSDNKIVNSYPHQAIVNSVSTTSDGKLLATGTVDGKINIWHQNGILQQTLMGHNGSIINIKFIPDLNQNGAYNLISTGVDKTVRIWQVFDHDRNGYEGIYSIVTSPSSLDNYVTADWDGKINFWRKNSDSKQKLVKTISAHEDIINQIKYSPDGKIIASAAWDKTIKLWDAETGKLIDTLIGHQDGVNTIAFTPDSQTLISASEDKTIKIWSILDKTKLIKTLEDHTDSIKAVTVSPDGQLIASGGYDNKIKIWSIAGELLQTIDAHKLAITSLQFIPDSNTLVSGSWDNTIKLWSIKNGGKTNNLLHTLTGHQDGVTTINLNSDGTVLASGSGDRNIKLWNTKTGELIKTLRGHTSQINSLAFSRNDQSIVSGEEQQGLFWWNLDLDNLLTQGCDRLADYLSTNPNIKETDKKLCQ